MTRSKRRDSAAPHGRSSGVNRFLPQDFFFDATMPARRRSGRAALQIVGLALIALALTGCGNRVLRLSAELARLPQEIPPEVLEATTNYERYLVEYQARYQLRPRPDATALGSAEAYMRKYQPGPLPRIFQTTIIYDRNGTKLAELVEEGHRTWVPVDQVSEQFLQAIIATEDATFYTNPGFDPRRVIGAMMQNAEAGEVVSGASTITMQLARLLFFTPAERYEQSMDRKAFEALLSQDLTALFTKDEILEMYINLVHFGRRVYGIEAASNLYFGKPAADLTLAEATLLAGIPQQPADYDLFDNFDAVKQRQRIVLNLMVRHGYLNPIEAQFVYATPVELQPEPTTPVVRAPHFVQYITDYLQDRLGDVDVERAGLHVTSTLDLRMQELAQSIVTEQVEQLRPTYDLSNSALVALKPGTAEILTMVGSADFNNPNIDGQVNVAVRLRQPGSAIKPVLYALAMDALEISPATVIWDVRTTYDISRDETYTPRNYDEDFHGPVTVRTALANSYNIPAVKLLDAVGVGTMLDGARAMGLKTLTRGTDWYGLSLTLGGGEVTLLDLTTAFHTLANQGQYLPPTPLLEVGNVPPSVEFVHERPAPQSVVSPQSAYLVTHIMQDNEARIPEFGPESALLLSKPAAAKTGTTTDYRDNWTEGYTRYLVAGVWAGNSDGRPMRQASGVTGAAPIWNSFMEAVLDDPELLAMLGAPSDDAAWEFPQPDGIVTEPVACPNALRCPETEVFDARWVARFGDQGPLADSVVVNTMNTVYVQRNGGTQAVGACSAETGTSRQLLRLPNGLTRGLPELPPDLQQEIQLTRGALAARAPEEPQQREPSDLELAESDPDLAEKIRDERISALRWAQSAGAPLYFGPCEGVEEVVRAIYGNVRVSVGGFSDQVVELDEAEEAENNNAGQPVATAQAPTAAASSSSYSAVGVAHDANCGGNYVMGSVVNGSGQPVAGVRVLYTDSLGNRTEQATSSAAQGYGSFRFPVIAVDQSHTINITLLGSGGGSISTTAFVPHRQGGSSDLGCHYVIWQGSD